MATTKKGIYYPSDGTQPADVLGDMKKMAESIDETIETNKFDDSEINESLKSLENEQKKQSENIEKNAKAISKNAENIEKNTELIQALKEENANLKAQIPTGEASGEEIDLSDSAEMELVDFGLQGNSKQAIREGYNLANYNTSASASLVNFKIGDILNGKHYTLYLLISDGTINFNLKNGQSDTGYIIRKENATGKVIITFTANQDGILYFNGFRPTEDYNGIEQIMLLEGTYTSENLPAFEEYGKMPSLDYPSEVEAVGDNGNVEIVKSNKNLLKLNNYSTTLNGININITNGNHIKLIGTATDNTTFYLLGNNQNMEILNRINKISSGKNIVLQKTPTESPHFEIIAITDTNNYYLQINETKSIATKLSNNEEIKILKLFIPPNINFNYEFDLQFEISNKATDIVQPKENTYNLPIQKPMYKLTYNDNTIKDIFIKQNNKWYEQHNNTKVFLKDLDWAVGSTEAGKAVNTKRWNSVSKFPHYESGIDHYAKSNSFNNVSGNLFNNDKEGFNIESNSICIRIPAEIATSATQVKEYFSQRENDYVVYPLATPELIECTSEQTEILNQIIKDGTYKGITHFYTTNDLKPEIEITYYKDLETIINKQVEMQATLDNVQAQLLNL